jgi:hypothetical protein
MVCIAMPGVTMLIVIMLNVIMLNVTLLSVIMLSVVTPCKLSYFINVNILVFLYKTA